MANAKGRAMATLGLWRPKHDVNVQQIGRLAACYGVSAVIVHARKRIKPGGIDTTRATRTIPFIMSEDLIASCPVEAVPIAVEITDSAVDITGFVHPDSAYYIFGPEDGTLPKSVMASCASTIKIPTSYCLNMAMAVNVVLYDRVAKQRATNQSWSDFFDGETK